MNYSEMSDRELLNAKHRLTFEISKYNTLQNAKKVCLNSAFGAFGNQYFRLYDLRLAEAITISGQFVIESILKTLNEYLNKVLKKKDVDYAIAADTDSVYLVLSEIVKLYFKEKPYTKQEAIDFLDKFCEEKLQPVIQHATNNIATYCNVFENKMYMKREAIADKGFWTAKKRYALNVYNEEGVKYATPKLKIMGLEAIKKSTPEVCRNSIKKVIKLILTDNEQSVIRFIQEFKNEFKTLSPLDFGKVSSVNNLQKYSDKNGKPISGTPGHVRAALNFNAMIKQMKLEQKYSLIREGDKIKTIYLREPNPSGTYSIAIIDEFPEEFKLDKYIDHEEQFNTVFLKPVRIMLDAIGWEHEKRADISDLFS